MENRDFKGVWIPKEIWLHKELSALDRVLLTEIDSLDNENHCTASNEYFAEFCGVSVPTITRCIKKLKELNFIETEMVTNSTGSYRVIKMIKGYNQNDERGLIKMTTNYKSNNNINNNVVSKDTTYMQQPEFEFGKPNKTSTKKKTNEDEYLDSVLLIDNFTDDNELKKLLKELFRNKCNECSSKRFHYSATTCKNYLDELKQIDDKIGAVRLSIRYNNTMKVMQPSTSPGINNVFSESEGMRKNQRKADKKDLATDEDGNYIVY